MVAQEAKTWDEAERCYRQSLKLKQSYNDLPGVARTCNQLAIVAKGAGRLHDTEQWYLRAQKIKDQISPQDASTLNNLADLYLSQGRLDEAASYACRAVAIMETLDLSAEPWKIYKILAEIALAQSRTDEAASWRRKEQDSYAAYAGAAHGLRQHQTLVTAVVQATQGSSQALAYLEGEYPKMRAGGKEWTQTAAAIQSIVLGERDFEALRVGLHYQNAYLIRAILSQLPDEVACNETEQIAEATETPASDSAQAPVDKQWEPLIEAVVAACSGDAEAMRNVGFFLASLSQQEALRELGGVLGRILAGERDAAVLSAGLAARDVTVVEAMLAALT